MSGPKRHSKKLLQQRYFGLKCKKNNSARPGHMISKENSCLLLLCRPTVAVARPTSTIFRRKLTFSANCSVVEDVGFQLSICALFRSVQSERERERFPPRDPERLRDSRFAERLRDFPLRERDRDRERDLDRERERPLRERLRVLDRDFLLRVPPLLMSLILIARPLSS